MIDALSTAPTAAWVVLVLIVGAAAASPLQVLPVGVLVALFVLAWDAPQDWVALAAGASIAVGRLVMGMRARYTARHGSSATLRGAVAGARGANWRRHRKTLAWTTFMAGAAPVLPARVVFPTLAMLGMPMGWAALGTFLSRTLLVTLTSTIALVLARAVTDDDEAALRTLATVAIVWIAIRFIRQVDWQRSGTERGLRLASDENETTRFQAWVQAHSPESPEQGPPVADQDVIEGVASEPDPESGPASSEGPESRDS